MMTILYALFKASEYFWKTAFYIFTPVANGRRMSTNFYSSIILAVIALIMKFVEEFCKKLSQVPKNAVESACDSMLNFSASALSYVTNMNLNITREYIEPKYKSVCTDQNSTACETYLLPIEELMQPLMVYTGKYGILAFIAITIQLVAGLFAAICLSNFLAQSISLFVDVTALLKQCLALTVRAMRQLVHAFKATAMIKPVYPNKDKVLTEELRIEDNEEATEEAEEEAVEEEGNEANKLKVRPKPTLKRRNWNFIN